MLKSAEYRKLELSTPTPLEEQTRIVQKVDELMAHCNQLKERLNQDRETHCQLAGAVVGQGLCEGDRDAGF
ncbi:hypothetical protein [Vreelandella arcis]|uniref:Type I restriction enzyme, S subunit n=1 Tax=Vreelandella arcis TaxID=416873 RepID=A0A1G9XKM3_9GAMM|nr:hypothetical protein [Halomonas arcis]SDM97317.1 type I restriction enzyme, S subunit [Halomonas arcis]